MKRYRDIKGDGGSQIDEQVAAQKRAIRARLRQVKHVLAIGSGKGGVGKSTLVMQIANCLAEQGRRVGILDCDINGPCQTRLGALKGFPVPGEEGLVLPKTEMGISVLSFANFFREGEVRFDSVAVGESFTWRATREFSALAELLASTEWGTLDLLILDLPPGAERTQQFVEFFGPSTNVVLVTIPSDLSREIVGRSVSALRSTACRFLGIIENMSGYFCANCQEVQPLYPEKRELELDAPILGLLPFDPMVAQLADSGELEKLPKQRLTWALMSEICVRVYSLLEREEKNEISVH